ncbi:2-oxo-4-hydroxy-4-carboxy-5-ureidoimidazoline (OHCU) decarboxylase [Klebsiella pneumoniae]|uniref:2-oxo-4-hydroxy-4-carboxy-5-ureidoimidazoline decarboxylase n=1 Tax=Klebsiella pneumoniae TaxID=573 RepID=A0A377TUT2_KLEPN|nr:2-oxo-4-hydroxy-4-carboxy-5-ureidoimidazoline (OHCU) decarboxylase [Klebsiella pneumoniae]
MDSENERLSQALREGNARYEARFGRVFLIRAKGRSGEEMLQALTRRLQHTADEEVAEALAQLREITMFKTGRSDWRMSTLSTHILDISIGYAGRRRNGQPEPGGRDAGEPGDQRPGAYRHL